MYKPTLKMLNVEPVGSYAIRIDWSDGHNTGIYSFDSSSARFARATEWPRRVGLRSR